MMKDIIKTDNFLNSELHLDSGLISLSLSNEASVGRKRKKSNKRKSHSGSRKGTQKNKHSFIHKLTKKKEAEMSEETAASIGNMKRHVIFRI